jgi:penicillin amidase
MKRKTKTVNILITWIVLLNLAFIPAAGGSNLTPLKNGEVRIIRDDYSVPHVFGTSIESLYYGFGYAEGQDRLWQADTLRRTADGTLAEFYGPSAVDGDIWSRTFFGSTEFHSAMLASAAPEVKLMYQWFAAGMNGWIDQARQTGQLPLEYQEYGLSPRPWTPEDSVAISIMIFSWFGEDGYYELLDTSMLDDLIARLGTTEGMNVFQDTHWLNDPSAKTTVPTNGKTLSVSQTISPKVVSLAGVEGGYDQFKKLQQGFERNLLHLGITGKHASNAIAISSKMSADGHALLLGGPQVGYGAPELFNEIGLHRANNDTTGITVPGMPVILIGTTNNFAWTMTAGMSDNTDWYYETLNDAGQYLFQGQWKDFDCHEETIHVLGAPDVIQEVCRSIHGPVVVSDPGIDYTIKVASRGFELNNVKALSEAQKARTISEIDKALSQFASNFNVMVADVRGNIAYWHAGMIPIRAAGDDPWLPHDGSGSAEWQGFIPWQQMPHATNPDQGWMANWNNKPSADWNNSGYGYEDFGPVQRVDRLMELLGKLEPGTASVATLEEINQTAGVTAQTPTYDAGAIFAPLLLSKMLAKLDSSADPRIPGIVNMLESWNLLQEDTNQDGFYDNTAVTIFNTWYPTFIINVFLDELNGWYDTYLVGNMTYRLLEDDPALPLLHDYLGGVTIQDAITSAMISSLDALTAQYGSPDPSTWLQPIDMTYWWPVGIGTVPDTIYMNRGTYNQIVHTGPGPKLFGENVVPPGQSGNSDSPHFSDQLQLYSTWTYKPMRLNMADLQGHIESIIVLHP